MATKGVSEEKRREIHKVAAERVKLEREALDLVIHLVESPHVDGLELKTVARGLSPSHYEDVVEERSISQVCGYPLCSRVLTNVPRQKFHISVERKRMYDLTDSKRFCSVFCYKASQYYASQLSSIPALWMRQQERHKEIKLLDQNSPSVSETDQDNNVAVPTNTDKSVPSEGATTFQLTQDTQSSLEDEFNSFSIRDTGKSGGLETHIQSLPAEARCEQISRNDDQPQPCTSTTQDPAAPDSHRSEDAVVLGETLTPKPTQCFSKAQFQEIQIKEVIVPKSVKSGGPICEGRQGNSPRGSSKQVLQFKSSVLKQANPAVSSKSPTASEMTSKLYRTLSQWCTPHTQWILSQQGWKDREGGRMAYSEARLIDPAVVASKEEEVDQGKEVSESVDAESKPDSSMAPFLPAVDHSSQLVIRRRIVLQKILPLIRTLTSLQVHLYSSDVTALVRTLRLQADNVMLSPMEWYIAAVVFLHCLSSKNESIARQLKQTTFTNHLSRLHMTAEILRPMTDIFIVRQ